MKFVPHEYQKYAIKFILLNLACALFLECGLGKTVILLTAVSKLIADGKVRKVLVVAPLRVALHTWSSECEKWDHLKHLKISKVLGTERERLKALQKQADVYVVNRENAEWLTKNWDWQFDMLVLDELSSFKSPSANRFKALRKIRKKINRIVGLTGTPTPNGLIDLWSQIYLLDRGERLRRTIGEYRDEYFLPDKRNQHVIYSYKLKAGAEKQIYDKLSDICISMKACDFLKMPERIDNVLETEMNEKETGLYKKLKGEMILSFADGDIDAVNAAALTVKLLQMANGAVYDENGKVKWIHDHKLDVLEDVIEASNGKPVLVFYSFQHDRDRIMRRFDAMDLDVDEWNKGNIPLALAHPASAGHGLNLQDGGSTVVWFGLTWSLELYQQANARLWRQGQKNTVVINHIITKGTIDEDILKALNTKENTQASLIEAVKANLFIKGENHDE